MASKFVTSAETISGIERPFCIRCGNDKPLMEYELLASGRRRTICKKCRLEANAMLCQERRDRKKAALVAAGKAVSAGDRAPTIIGGEFYEKFVFRSAVHAGN